MEAKMKGIKDLHGTTTERPLQSLLEDHEPREPQTGVRRQSVGHRFSLHALRGDERRGGKTAKLVDLCTRLNFGGLYRVHSAKRKAYAAS
jgi:hypothetical protein